MLLVVAVQLDVANKIILEYVCNQMKFIFRLDVYDHFAIGFDVASYLAVEVTLLLRAHIAEYPWHFTLTLRCCGLPLRISLNSLVNSGLRN